jgi:hypothetical protein
LDSVALNLHSFCTGLESLFELIVSEMDQTMPSGERWHRQLLLQVSNDVPDVRPAVISSENAKRLDEFRRFRHLVRNIYASELLPERMADMLTELPGLWASLRSEPHAFADFLHQAASSSGAA